MIGRAFTGLGDGDVRSDPAARELVSATLGIGSEWATVTQVHGAEIVTVCEPGLHGEADAMMTDIPGIPLAVFTADCLGIVVHTDEVVAVVHAGWRGLAGGIGGVLASSLAGPIVAAAVGPCIGSCCFAVGPDVVRLFPGFERTTRRGELSVDLVGVAESQLGFALERHGGCTVCAPGSFSHRGRKDVGRMAAIGWVG